MPSPSRFRRLWLGALVVACLLIAAGVATYTVARGQMYRVQLFASDSMRPGRMAAGAQRLEALMILNKVGKDLRKQADSDLEFAQLVAEWVHWNVRPHYDAPMDIISDGPFGALVRGHGYCDQLAGIAATIFWSEGYPVRMFALRDPNGVSPHAIMEVQIAGRWRLVDPWSGVAYARDGDLVGLAEMDEALLEHWGVRTWDLASYKRGDRWNIFPFLTPADIVDRFRRSTLTAPAYSSDAYAPGIKHVEPPPEVRRAYTAARLKHLRGEDARADFRALQPKLADPDLRGAAQYFILQHAATRGEALPHTPLEGAWAPSRGAILARLGHPAADVHPVHRDTITRLVKEQAPTILRPGPDAPPARAPNAG